MSVPLEHDYAGLSTTAGGGGELDLNDTELRLGLPGSVDLTLGLLPLKTGGAGSAKRWFSDAIGNAGNGSEAAVGDSGVARGENAGGDRGAAGAATATPPAAKAQIVGWPPIRSYRKNSMASKKKAADAEGKQGMAECCLYVKVSMDGAPYLRKVDLKHYSNYKDLSLSLEKMFTCFTSGEECCSNGSSSRESSKLKDLLHGSEYVLTYEDRDGDWMLVGDVPWDMFADSCRRMRIMKGSEAIGIASPRTMEKSKSRF